MIACISFSLMSLYEIYFINVPHHCTPRALLRFLLLYPGNFHVLPSVYVTCFGFSSTFSFWDLSARLANLPGFSSKPVSFFITKSRHILTQKHSGRRISLCVVFCINFILLLTLKTKPNQTKPQDNRKLTNF